MAGQQETGWVAEEKLIAAIRSGKTLDLSLDQDRKLSSAALRKVLTTVDGQHPNGLRLRGANIEDGLDLRGVEGRFPVSLIDCETHFVRLESKSVPEITMLRLKLGDAPKAGVADLIRRMNKTIPTSFAITALLFAFLAIKVLWVALGDVPTALAVFGSSPPTTVIVGGLLSGVSVVTAAALGISAYLIFAGPGFSKLARGLFLLLAITACSFLTPLLVAAVSAALGLFAGWLVRRADHNQRDKGPRAPRIVARTAALISGMVAIVLIIPVLMAAVWLPHEVLTVTNSPDHPVGYLLDDTNGWVTLLHSGDRRILRIPSDQVVQRRLCQPDTAPAGTLPWESSLWTQTLWSQTLWSKFAAALGSSKPVEGCGPYEN